MEWLTTKKRALLAFEMGLGKTRIAIAAANKLKVKNILVLAPAIAVVNWYREFYEFGEVTPCVFSYGSVHKIPPRIKWDLAILDESHYLKSVDAARTRCILGKNAVLSRVCGPIWGLSGTPAPNHAGELWTLVFTFGATDLTYAAWLRRFCESRTFKIGNRYISQITGTKISAIPELQEILNPVMLRLTKEQAMIDLPPITFEHISVPANEVDNQVLFPDFFIGRDRSDELFKILEKERDALAVALDTQNGHNQSAPAIPTLTAAVPHIRRVTGMQKVKAVGDLIVEELKSNAYQKIVIFAVHQVVIETLRLRLKRFGAVTCYGRTPPEERQNNIDKFNRFPNCRVFIANIQAAGTAITLTAAHQVLFAESSYVPGENAQASMRCHRIGQKNPVTVRFVSLENSIDQKIVSILRRKAEELTQLFDPEIYKKKFLKQLIDDKNNS